VWRNGEWVTEYVHRVVWDIIGDPLAENEQSLHRCDNPACVNVESHLFKGTQTDNLLDGAAKARAAGRKWRNNKGKLNPNYRHGNRMRKDG
jgi:hypothetical protein